MTSRGFTWAAYLGGAYLGAPILGRLSWGGEAIQGLIPPAHVQNHGR
jgi:hypothetical protein